MSKPRFRPPYEPLEYLAFATAGVIAVGALVSALAGEWRDALAATAFAYLVVTWALNAPYARMGRDLERGFLAATKRFDESGRP